MYCDDTPFKAMLKFAKFAVELLALSQQKLIE